ncbi:MAG TPA: hypothetical protein VKZ97_09880 [Flavobacteriaceae bacterium]|nr:hypothetical protein [Flavobacteriaceae bacterium]
MKHLICSSFGHQLLVSKQVTKHVVEYRCKRCNEQFTLNGNGHIVELTEKSKDINRTLETLYKKKVNRKRALQNA